MLLHAGNVISHLTIKQKKEGKTEHMSISEIAININWDGFSSLYPKLSKRKDEWTKILS